MAVIPKIHPVCDMDEAIEYAKGLDKVIVPYELAGETGFTHTKEVLEGLKGAESVGVFIGPEGGFDSTEIEALKSAGAEIITLGKRILRTETAGMTVMSWLVYLFEE